MFNSEICKQIGLELQEAAVAIAAKYGLQATRKGGTYDSASFTAKVEFFADDKKEAKEKETFKLLAKSYGLKPEWYGKEVALQGSVYTIVGLAPKRQKYPVIVSKGGKRYKVRAEDVAQAMS